MKYFYLILASVLFLQCNPKPSVDLYEREWSSNDKSYLLENLDSSFQLVHNSIEVLNEKQWNYRPDSDSLIWSPALIIEHLIIHEELFYRELKVLSTLPIPVGQKADLFVADSAILSYKDITPANSGSAPEYLQPVGRWCSKEAAVSHYANVREAMMLYLKGYDKNLRAFYTKSGRGPTEFRDLHQLMLISIAHTLRHHKQIVSVVSELPEDSF